MCQLIGHKKGTYEIVKTNRKEKPPDRAKWAEVGGLTLRAEEAPQQGNVTTSAFELYISNDRTVETRSDVSGRGSSRDRLEAVYEITCSTKSTSGSLACRDIGDLDA